VVAVLLLDQAHILKCLHVGLIILEHLSQLLLGLLVLALADVVVCYHQPRTLKVMRVL
jgi:hypothetical protein